MRWSLIGTLALGSIACAPTEVVLAEIPAPADGGVLPRPPPPCVDDGDCAPVEFCSRPPGCVPGPGRCELTPLFCPATMEPVCGCDGVTYWNDCMRRHATVAVESIGECSAAPRRCVAAPGGECPPGLFCRRIAPPSLPCPTLDAPGVCWSVPESCEGDSRLPMAEICESAGKCIDVCTAIRSERPHRIGASPACR